MLTSNARRKLIAFSMFAMPVAIVKVAATMLGGPSVQAQTTLTSAPAPAPNAVVPAVELTPDQQAVAEHVARLREQAFGATPMLHVKASGGPVILDPTSEDKGVPEFTVKAIMVSSTGNRALIGGKAYKVGEELEDTPWVIIDINGNTRSVTIQEPETGRVTTGSVEGPGLD